MSMRLQNTISGVLLALSLATPLAAQSTAVREKTAAQSQLAAAESLLRSAQAAGAATLATDLYNEATDRLQQARSTWNSNDSETRQRATLRAIEGGNAAAAAEALAHLVAANTEIRNLRTDIGTFGVTPAMIALYEPAGSMTRGLTSADRVIVAENALKTARLAGGDRVAGSELKRAESILGTARMLAKREKQDERADHLAYIAEMLSRRAEYVARRNAISPNLPELRSERTRLAQRAADTRAQQEQERRLEAERQSAELRRQLAAESANRQAEQAEVERLRQQVAQTETQFRTRLDEDRAARLAAELTLTELIGRYQIALSERGSSSVEVEQLRRQVEDQSMSLRTIQERERLNETSLGNQISGLESALERERSEGRLTAEVLAQRENELRGQREDLQRLVAERAESERRRVEADASRAAAIAESERRSAEAQAQSEMLRQQIAEERTRTAETEAELTRARETTAQTEAELARARAATAQTEAELTRAREELGRRDSANLERMSAMQAALSKLAATRTSERGFIVTLPGLFFDSGKSVLKAGARNTLTKIADQLRINAETSIAVEGHTDSKGTDALNQALSERRATAVRDYLVSRGVPSSKITMTGLGETSPVATNDTAAGRQQNRRVELVISQ